MRPRKPLNSTANRMTAASVIVAVSASVAKLLHAVGARLKPIRATIAPATTGGMSLSTQPRPANCTTRPITASRTPTATMPASADPIPADAVAAVTGAMKAKDEPR
ncbi:hypothetical protein GCM10009746_10810 [Microbacterium paludicola]